MTPITRLSPEAIEAKLAGLPGWALRDDKLQRQFRFADFVEAFGFMSRVALLAEAANHHPDVHITGYRNVTFELTTHAAHAVTRRDIELATEIDRLIIGAE